VQAEHAGTPTSAADGKTVAMTTSKRRMHPGVFWLATGNHSAGSTLRH
jgi:hypothetical protein